MPTNKNAMLRYKVLDGLLSSKYHRYSLDDLREAVADRLSERNPDTNGITRRQIEKDLNFMEETFGASIENYTDTVFNREKQKTVRKRCKRYEKPGFTIFNKELSSEEEYILSEVLSLLGQFEGLPDFDGLERLRGSFDVRESQRIVSFTRNPLEGSNLFGRLFSAIAQRQVISILHHPFGAGRVSQKHIIHPYLLKEYNRRWFLIALSEGDGKIRNFGLDRIQEVEPLTDYTYIPYEGDIEELFEDVVGVTVLENVEPEDILFWVGDASKEYVETKPIHDSQKQYKGESDEQLRREFPGLTGGCFFSVCCKENYELLRELMSFGENLIVLRPAGIRNKVIEKIKKLGQAYNIFENCEQ